MQIANAVPRLEPLKERVLGFSARVIIEISEHQDGKGFVLSDPFGNKFEPTKFRG